MRREGEAAQGEPAQMVLRAGGMAPSVAHRIDLSPQELAS
jgi:hypothetical protein